MASGEAPVRWGILSTARINDKFLAGMREAAGARVVAVASRDGNRAREYAAERGIERAYDSYETLLADADVEAVYIPLPNALHLEWSRRALDAGKHVLCEKPLSASVEGVAEAFDLAERRGRLLMEAFMYRHNPQTQRLAQLIADGAVGRLRLIRASFSFPLDDPANVRLSARLAGGSLMDVGCYCVSAVRLLAGEPVSVTGAQVTGGDGVDVAFAGVLTCTGDVLAHFDSGFVLAARHDLEVVGEEGTIVTRDPWHCVAPGLELRRGDAVESLEVPVVNSYRLQAENLSAAIRGGAMPLLGREDALGQARTIEALYASAAEGGRAVALPAA